MSILSIKVKRHIVREEKNLIVWWNLESYHFLNFLHNWFHFVAKMIKKNLCIVISATFATFYYEMVANRLMTICVGNIWGRIFASPTDGWTNEIPLVFYKTSSPFRAAALLHNQAEQGNRYRWLHITLGRPVHPKRGRLPIIGRFSPVTGLRPPKPQTGP